MAESSVQVLGDLSEPVTSEIPDSSQQDSILDAVQSMPDKLVDAMSDLITGQDQSVTDNADAQVGAYVDGYTAGYTAGLEAQQDDTSQSDEVDGQSDGDSQTDAVTGDSDIDMTAQVVGIDSYALSPITTSDGLKGILLDIVGPYDNVVTQFKYQQGSNSYYTYVNEITPDYPWIASALLFIALLLSIFSMIKRFFTWLK